MEGKVKDPRYMQNKKDSRISLVKVRSNKILTFKVIEDFVFKHHCNVPTLDLQAYIPIFEYGLFLEVHS